MDDAEVVKNKVDIVEVISSYIPLKKAGRNYSGLCPFHGEKTPSFMVSAERQVFKCFGCGESGDVYTFLEKQEGWEFREALEELADRAGVKLTAFKKTSQTSLKEKLVSINNLASKFYKYILLEHKAGESARNYLKGRGIPKPVWEKFDLGYAPGGWENLSKFLAKRSVSVADVATAGLIVGRDNRGSSYYDRFRDRIIFPIKDSRGTILGFSGRLLKQETGNRKQETRSEAKYVNSPQTPVFNKGSLLFGLDIARSSIRDKGEAVLVEGEFDVLSAFAAGVENVVASKGTALTELQVAILSRLCERVILCFDADLAGDAASRRGIELLDIAGISVKVAKLGKYKDPDEFAQSDAAGFKKALEGAEDVYDYFLESASKRFNASSVDGKKKIGRELVPIIAKISDDMVRAHYIGKLAEVLDLEVGLVSEAVSKKSEPLFVEGGALPSGDSKSKGKILTQEDYFLALLFFGEEIPHEIIELLIVSDFEKDESRKLWKALRDIINDSKVRSTSKLLKKLPKDLSGYIDELYLVNVNPEFSEKEAWAGEVLKVAKLIKRASLKRQLTEISSKLKETRGKSSEKETAALFAKFSKVSEYIKKIKI